MASNQPLKLITELCTACRACELACHHHHRGTFGTTSSSIYIDFDGDTGTIHIRIDSSCDHCRQEPKALCSQACMPGAIRMG